MNDSKISRVFTKTLLAIAIFNLPQILQAQWPANPANNLAICTSNGEQTVPKVAATSDGGCFVAWYDHRGTNYDVYIQYLDPAGVPQLGNNGLLVSNHTQDTWITDWDMTVDLNDNAIFAVNDIRAGGDWDIYGYSVSTDGTFNWGIDGITLSNNAYFEPTPQVMTANDGNIYFAWQQETDDGYVINVYKVSPAGQDMWMPATITLSSEFGLSIPRLAPTNDGGFLLQYLVAQGGGFPTPNHLYIQRFNASGIAQWETAGVGLNVAGGFGFAPLPNLVSDGNNGAVSFWYDSRTMQNHVYLERINGLGNVSWTRDGVLASTANELQTSPAIAFNPATGNTTVFYQTSNTGQTASGLGAQLFNAAGERQWTDNGIALVPLSTQQQYLLQAFPQSDGTAVVVYLEYVAGSAVNALLKAIKLDDQGNMVWGPTATVLASTPSSKGHLAASVRPNGTVVAAWHDDRNGNPDIFIQNVNPDGSFGQPTVLNPSLVITSPSDSTIIHSLPLDVQFNVSGFAVAPAGSGDGMIHVEVTDQTVDAVVMTTWLDSLMPVTILPEILQFEGPYKVRAMLTGYDSLAIDPVVADSINFTYQPPTLTITSPADSSYLPNGFVPYPFSVTDFPLGPDSGRVLVELDNVLVDTLFNASGDSVMIEGDGVHTLKLTLQNADGSTFSPTVRDSVNFQTFIWDDLQPEAVISQVFALLPTYPNPFNPSTTIRYNLGENDQIRLVIFDLKGRQVTVLWDGSDLAGEHSLTWNSNDVASGIYLLRLETRQGYTATQKLVKLK
ncbi:MAG TPA: hypothetical protein DHU63_04505 [Candidatus Marinimicrobia bacterium]|nr:hypothetical protein [Candidatus Neomarinimicrobiota bacterium]